MDDNQSMQDYVNMMSDLVWLGNRGERSLEFRVGYKTYIVEPTAFYKSAVPRFHASLGIDYTTIKWDSASRTSEVSPLFIVELEGEKKIPGILTSAEADKIAQEVLDKETAGLVKVPVDPLISSDTV